MDANLNQRRLGLEQKIPDIRKTLSMVEYLQERRVCAIVYSLVPISFPIQEGTSPQSEDDQEDDLEDEGSSKAVKTTFELNETLFAEAELEDGDTVFLWLGVCVSSHPFYHSSNLFHSGQRHAILQDTRCH